MSNSRKHIHSVFRLFSWAVILFLLLGANRSYAQEEGEDFGEATEEASKDTKKFFSYFTDWVMLSHIHRSGENAAQVDNLFNTFLKDYANNPILQEILSAFTTGELGASSEEFFRQTGIRLYFVGTIDLSKSDPRFEPVLSLLNESLTAKVKNPSAPYIIVTNTLSGDNEAGYTIATTVRYSDEIKAGKYNLDKTNSSNPFIASLNPSAAKRKDAGDQIKTAMLAGVSTLSSEVKENYLPNLMITYKDKLYKSEETIKAAVSKNGSVILEAINKELDPVSDLVEWSISPDNEQSAKAVEDNYRFTFPADKGGEFAIQARTGNDEVNITLKIQGLGQDLKDLLKKLLLDALKPRLEAAIQQRNSMKGDSTETSNSVVTNIRNIENANFPLEGDGLELSILQEPTALSDTSVFSESQDRLNALQSLRKKKNLLKNLEKVYRLVSYIDKVLKENDKEVTDLLDALVENSGELLAQFVITGLSQNDSTAMKDIVADFLDENLADIAGSSGESAFSNFLEPIDPPQNYPSEFNQGDNYYISPLVPLEDRDKIIQNITAYQATQQNPTFVVINYSQDVSMESYLARAPTGAPKGLSSGQDYVVINYVNIPGSVIELIATDKKEEADKILGEREEEGGYNADPEDYVVRIIETLRCGFVNETAVQIDDWEMLRSAGDYSVDVELSGGVEIEDLRFGSSENSQNVAGLLDQTDYIFDFQEPTMRDLIDGWRLTYAARGGGQLSFKHYRKAELEKLRDYLKPSRSQWEQDVNNRIAEVEELLSESDPDVDEIEKALIRVGCGLTELDDPQVRYQVLKLIGKNWGDWWDLLQDWSMTENQEKTVVDLLATTTGVEKRKALYELIKQDDTGLLDDLLGGYALLGRSVDGEQLQAMHLELAKYFYENVDVQDATTLNNILSDELQDDLLENDYRQIEYLAKNNIFLWSDPGFIKFISVTDGQAIDYDDFEIAKNGNISFSVDHKSIFSQDYDASVSDLKPFDPVIVMFLTKTDDFFQIKPDQLVNFADRGGFLIVPALAMQLIDKNKFSNQAWRTFDVATFAIPFGIFAKAGRWGFVAYETVLFGLQQGFNDYAIDLQQSESGKQVLRAWMFVNVIISIAELKGNPNIIKKPLANLKSKVSALPDNGPSRIKQFKDDAAKLLEGVGDLSVSRLLDDLFQHHSVLKKFSNGLDEASKTKLYEAVKDFNSTSLTKLNRSLKATPNGDEIHNGFGELILKLADDYKPGLSKIASSSWTDDMIKTLKGKLGRSEYPDMLDDLSDPVLFGGAEKMLKDPINAKVYYDELLESNLSSASLERLSKSQFFNELKNLANAHESAVTEIARSGSRAPFSTWKSEGYIHHAQFYLKRVAEKFTGSPKQTVSGGKTIIGDDVHVVKHYDDDGIFDYHRAKINDSKYRDSSPWTPNQKSELINRFKNNSKLEYIEFEVRSELSRYPNTPFTQTNKKVRVYREDVFKTTSDGNGTINPTTRVF